MSSTVAPVQAVAKKVRNSKGKQADLFISPRRVENDRRTQMMAAPQISSSAMVFEAAIVQSIIRKVIELARAHAEKNGRVRIQVKDIHHALQSDAKLRAVFPKTCFLHADHITMQFKPRQKKVSKEGGVVAAVNAASASASTSNGAAALTATTSAAKV